MLYALLTSMILNFSISPDMSHENETHYTKNKIDNYDIITISQSGSLFYSVTNQILQSVNNLNTNVTFIGRANVGLESTTFANNEINLTTLDNFLYNLSIKTIESSVVDYFYDEESAQAIRDNKIVISELTASRYELNVGDYVNLVGLNSEIIPIEVGKVIKDSKIGWFEGVVNKELGFKLGIYRNIQAIIWDSHINENFLIELHKNINYRKVKLTFRENKVNKKNILKLIDGVKSDIKFTPYETIDQLLNYCHKVAGVVGIMFCEILGIDDNNALIKANDLGIAMQLTNIMRDIFEDANMGRVYLPHELFGRINPYDINIQNKDVVDNIYSEKIDQIYNIAETKYLSGISGLKYLNYNHKFIVYISAIMYREIGNKIIKNKESYSSGKRSYVSFIKKIELIVKCFFQIFLWKIKILK